MGRLLILLGLVSVVAVVYALMPAEYVPPPKLTQTEAQETPPRAEEEAPVEVREKVKAKPKAKPIRTKKSPSAASKALDVAPDEEALTAEEEAIFKPLPTPPPAPPVQTVFPTTPRPSWTKRHGRDPATPMPLLPVQPIKKSARAFYGNLPKGGRMPAHIEIQEVLPLSVIEAINVPPESRLTMLGPFDTSVTDGLKMVLDLSEQQQGIFGVSVVTPNGEKHREYIQTKP